MLSWKYSLSLIRSDFCQIIYKKNMTRTAERNFEILLCLDENKVILSQGKYNLNGVLQLLNYY